MRSEELTCLGKELEIEIYQYEEDELNEHLQEVARSNAEGHNQPWEIDLTKHVGISGEDIRAKGEGLTEIIPEQDAGHVKKWLRCPIGTDAG